MEPEYIKMIEDLVAELLDKYTTAIVNTKDEYEYCTIVTAALVFKELALVDFKKSILRDSDDDPDDICEIINNEAKGIAQTIRMKSLKNQQTLN